MVSLCCSQTKHQADLRASQKSPRPRQRATLRRITRNFSKKGSKYEKRSPPKCARTLNLTEIGLCFAPARLKPWRVSARWRFSPTRSRLMRILPSPAFPVHTGGRGFALILAQIFLCGNCRVWQEIFEVCNEVRNSPY